MTNQPARQAISRRAYTPSLEDSYAKDKHAPHFLRGTPFPQRTPCKTPGQARLAGRGTIEKWRPLFEGNLNFRVAAGRGCVDGGCDRAKMLPNKPPRRVSKHNDRDVPAGKVLPIAHVLVGRQQQIEARAFSQLEQFAI